LYDFCVAIDTRVRAWRPRVPGVAEVLHARMTSHVYPMHAHEAWTLLIVDDGMITYDLHGHEHGAMDRLVTLLPPQVPHNGRAATSAGFGKRVVYLDLSALPASLIGHAVDQPVLSDALLRQRISQLHRAVDQPGEEFEAESRLAFIAERLRWHLGRPGVSQHGVSQHSVSQHRVSQHGVSQHGDLDAPRAGPSLAEELRGLIDSRFPESVTLREAAAALHAHPAHLVRAFGRAFGMSPHQYLTSRRVDLARRLLLDGLPAARAATEAGFYDQPHLSRHFRHILGTSPGRYARSGSPPTLAQRGYSS
jgi:AraC-like DNA-binding protein